MKLKELSVGGLVYLKQKDRIFYLLIKQSTNGLWEFPKGNINKNESEINCAKREISEETGIKSPALLKNFREELEYINPKKGSDWLKKEIYYLFKVEDNFFKLSWEHSNAEWLTFEEAINRISFENLKNILKKANQKVIINEKFERALMKITNNLIKNKNPICFFVTGSYYNQTLRRGSDLDVFVVTNPGTKREKGVLIVEGIKVSYFINPINKVYNLLLEEKEQYKRPTCEMIFFSISFLDKKVSNDLKKLAFESLNSKLPKKKIEEFSYLSWKLYDKLNSYLVELSYNNSKAYLLENDLFNFSVDVFFTAIKRDYKPHTKYILNRIKSLDVGFFKLVCNYLSEYDKRSENIKKLVNYLLNKLKFKKSPYAHFSSL